METNMRYEEQIGHAWAQFQALAERADAESKANGGTPHADTRLALDLLSGELDRLEALVTRQEQLKAGGLVAAAPEGELVLNGTRYSYATQTADHRLFVKALRGGMRGLTDSERDRVQEMKASNKAMSEADDTLGGYGASMEFANDILRAMSDASPVRRVARVIPTGQATGEMIPVRAGIQVAKRISEVAQRVQTTADLSFKLEQVPVHEVYADTVVSNHLLQDSRYPLDAELRDAFVNAAALLEGDEFVSGTGNGEMAGIDGATLPAGNVITCADSSGHTIAADDVLKLLGTGLKAAYMDGARLLVNPKVMSALRLLKATSGNTYLFPHADVPGYFCGVPYALLADLADNATPAAGNKVAYFMHPMAYALVVRQDVFVQRLTEMLAEAGKTAFYIWQRTGGQMVLPEAMARLVTA